MRCFVKKKHEKPTWLLYATSPRKEQGTLIHWLQKDEKKNKTTAFRKETPGALHSELSYKLLAAAEGHYLLEVNPVTGRPHQIRVQLASMGCPIKGDLKYGDDTAADDASIALHARRLSFIHPVKKEPVTFEAPVPVRGFWKYFLKFEH